MKRKKSISILLKKVNVANLNYVKAGNTTPDDTHTCSGPKKCPTTIDPRTDMMGSANGC